MRKALVIGIALFLVALAVCLVPHRRSKVDALQENLWTSSRDGWGSPVAKGKEMEILDWSRTQYGIQWAWLVVDREVGGEAWSARMEPKTVLIYLLASGVVGALVLPFTQRLRNHLPGQRH